MNYDPEKYREKREKVLGIKKRGLSFTTIASLVAGIILLGLSFVTLPQAVSYIATRHLDDAIYKVGDKKSLTDLKSPVIKKIKALEGVTSLNSDMHDTRLIVTFDRREVDISSLGAVFKNSNLDVTLLNRVNHRQRLKTLKEEEELETP